MRGSIVLVDDERSQREFVEEVLGKHPDLAVSTFEDGASALQALERRPVDLVIFDDSTTGPGDGEFLAGVRERRPDALCMILTEDEETEEAHEALRRGEIHRLLVKPCDRDELREAVQTALRERLEERELEMLRTEAELTDEQVRRARRVARHLQKASPIAEVLIELGYLSEEDYESIQRARRARMTIAEILRLDGALDAKAFEEYLEAKELSPGLEDWKLLVEGERVTEEQYLRALAAKHQIPYVDPEPGLVDVRLLARTSIPYLVRHRVLPMHMVEGKLTVLMTDPLNAELRGELERIFESPIDPRFASGTSILQALHTLDRARSEGAGAPTSLQYREIHEQSSEEESGEAAVQVVDYLLLRAIQMGASDLHIEPQETKIRVRVRVDGVLRKLTDLPGDFSRRVASRLKILAGADIAEKRLHQDGRILVKVEGREVDIRFSSYASMFGENTVLRILDRKQGLIPLDDLGFVPPVLTEIRDVALQASTGLVLVTGPTGSGKTTTLYSFVNHLNDPVLKVITCEDPVEYVLEGVIQCSVNEKTGPTFTDSLRAILRQDPDVILVGEVRDRRTAALAVESALTGHKVLSTLHTEDAVGSILRLLDMDLEAFLVASTLTGVIAQRLVRKICRSCRRRGEPTRSEMRFLSLERSDLAGLDLVEGAGCSECGGTGYRGRVAIHEVLLADDDFRDAILRRASSKELRALARRIPTYMTLQEDGLIKAMQGATTLAEVATHTPRDTDGRGPARLREMMSSWRNR